MYKLQQFLLMLVSHLPGQRWHKVYRVVLVDPCDERKQKVIYTRLVPRSTSSQYYEPRNYKISFHGGGDRK